MESYSQIDRQIDLIDIDSKVVIDSQRVGPILDRQIVSQLQIDMQRQVVKDGQIDRQTESQMDRQLQIDRQIDRRLDGNSWIDRQAYSWLN